MSSASSRGGRRERQMLEFADFARAHGLLVEHPIMDGRVHRCPTEDHPKKKNGAYRYEGDWGWVQAWEVHSDPIVWHAGKSNAAAPIAPKRDLAAIRREEAQRRARRRTGGGNHQALPHRTASLP